MKQIDENTYEVDGILFQRDGNIFVMSFKVGGFQHTFRIKWINAVKMAEVMKKLFLDKN